ncbi:MAG TPA: phage portal protein [Dehalococcoidia bacterium]|nr:phage portal protein [Dehalococcoidia bacterium]
MTDFNPSHLNRMDTQRLAAYRSNLDFYQGAHWPTQSRHRQLVFNYAKVSIDKLTSFLMPGLGFACYPVADVASDSEAIEARVRRAEQLLRQVYEQNNLQQLDYETEIDTAILGDGCYKVIWDTDEKRIHITAPDVSGIHAWWLGDDTSRVWRIASRYTLTWDEIQMLYGDVIASVAKQSQGIATSPRFIGAPRNDRKGATRNNVVVTELWTDKAFDLYLDNDLIGSRPNPYGFIPFIIFPNIRDPKHFWGVSDIPSIIQPQRELNRALSQLSRILELSGNPIAVLENIASAEDIKVQPGALWTIPEDAKAYLLDLLQGGGVRLHVDYIDLLYRALHDVSEMPRAAWGGIEKEFSGTALRIELGSLIQKVVRKRTIRTNVYHQRNAMILKLAEMFMNENFEGVNHRVVWGPILPQDIDRQAQTEQLLVQAGVHSRRTAMDEMGVQDPDEEFNRWLEERERILQMNQEFRATSTRGGARESGSRGDGSA